MKRFAALVTEVSSSTGTNDKLDALVRYFNTANENDKLWTLALFTGRRPRRAVSATQLRTWCAELAQLPQWLFDESYLNVGDLSETVALILPESTSQSDQPLSYWATYLQDLLNKNEEQKKEAIISAWLQLSSDERYIFNKLMSGAFRIGVSQATMVNAIAKVYNQNPQVISHRISGKWSPDTTTFEELITGAHADTDASKPYPFYLAYPLEEETHTLGEPQEWQVEWKWDGIRGQIIKRKGDLFVWSRGEELMTEKFPEYQVLKNYLEDGVAIDGEIICFQNGQPLPFNVLQTRIGRKNVSKKILQEAPAVFIAYDIMEWKGEDVRNIPQEKRREILEELIAGLPPAAAQILRLSPVVTFHEWKELAEIRGQSRQMVSEGLMLKRKSAIYQAGRKRGDWWKWKVDPLTIDCVLVAAQKGHGRRANLYTDYTFALKDNEGKLVTFAKAYSGLTDKEFVEVDAFIKRHIIEKFGPVRTVKPELVFELGFEGISESKRHKSGVAVRFPRMLRWRKDKTVDEINTLEDLRSLINQPGEE